jgi:hypothetical protein
MQARPITAALGHELIRAQGGGVVEVVELAVQLPLEGLQLRSAEVPVAVRSAAA